MIKEQDVFRTLGDITRRSFDLSILIRGFLVPSKGIYEIWFPYSIETAKLLKPGVFLAVRNFSSISLSTNEKVKENCYSILEVIDVDFIHYQIKALSENPQEVAIEKQFEKFLEDWYRRIGEPEKETLKIVVKAVLHDEELVISSPEVAVEKGQKKLFFFRKSSSPPISGERVFLIKDKVLEKFINGSLKEKKSSFTAGKHKIYGKISVLIDTQPLFNRHFAVFGFTGAGKSNLMSTLIYKSLLESKTEDSNVVIFDINNEYFGLLFDVLLKVDGALVFLENPGGYLGAFLYGNFSEEIVRRAAEELVDRTALPVQLLKEKGTLYVVSQLLLLSNKVKILTKGKLVKTVVSQLMEKAEKVVGSGRGSRELKGTVHKIFETLIYYLTYIGVVETTLNAHTALFIKEFFQAVLDVLSGKDKNTSGNSLLNQFISLLSTQLSSISDERKNVLKEAVQETFINFESYLKNYLTKVKFLHGISHQELISKLHDKSKSLFIFLSEDDNGMRKFANYFGDSVYFLRKNGHVPHMPQTLFVFEEADMFMPYNTSGLTKEEKEAVEMSKRIATTIARRGRKYNLGIAIATQRITYLDTSITAQFATYFVSKLPKKVDRERVAEAFGVEPSVLDRTLSYLPGEWMILTHVDTLHRKAVPVPVKFENANERLLKSLQFIKEQQEKLIEALTQRLTERTIENTSSFFKPLPEEKDLTPVFLEA